MNEFHCGIVMTVSLTSCQRTCLVCLLVCQFLHLPGKVRACVISSETDLEQDGDVCLRRRPWLTREEEDEKSGNPRKSEGV